MKPIAGVKCAAAAMAAPKSRRTTTGGILSSRACMVGIGSTGAVAAEQTAVVPKGEREQGV
jgi:hypothetical protein